MASIRGHLLFKGNTVPGYLFTKRGLKNQIANRDRVIGEQRARAHTCGELKRSTSNEGPVMEDYEVERERDLLSIRLRPIQDSLLQYEIVDTPNHAREVCIGLEVTIQRYDENDHFRVGAPTTYTVGDYVGTDLHAKPHPLLSYTSPIMSALMGKKVDVYADHYPIRIGDRTIYVELLDIKLPQTVCTVRQLAA